MHVGHLARVLPATRHDAALRKVYLQSVRLGWRERRELKEAERFVFFVGHGFSGHTLLGSLLNAHPDAVISHELDAFGYLASGFGRNQLLGLIRHRDRTWAEHGRVQNDYSYVVPGQWQGRVRRLTVIGDKKGGVTTWHLADNPELLGALRAEIRLPLRVVYVTRSPLDNLGSMLKTMPYSLTEAVAIWRRQVETVAWLRTQLGADELFCVSTESVKQAPEEQLRALCAFVGLEATEDFVTACAAFVEPALSRSRSAVPFWPAEVLAEIEQVTHAHDFLHWYLDDLSPVTTVEPELLELGP
jgi:hypothetical protein